jgi:hypothetical protein
MHYIHFHNDSHCMANPHMSCKKFTLLRVYWNNYRVFINVFGYYPSVTRTVWRGDIYSYVETGALMSKLQFLS